MRKLITSALPYVNNSPHLGNIIGCVLSADVYARFCRSRGYETLYICGTDEYGTATETAALKANTTPKALCDKFFEIHKSVYAYFNISFDAFGRTSHETHKSVVQDMFIAADQRGFFTSCASEQMYCDPCSRFLADRLIEGVCPHCQSPEARGDQCDRCAKLLTPTELQAPKCTLCQHAPRVKATEHLYLNLETLSPALASLHKQVTKGSAPWTTNATTTTQSWMQAGLKPRPITRDLHWGIPVPKEGFEHKVFYVWFDAPIGYISMTKHAFPDTWQSWWLNPTQVQLYQFMAKDNIPFHSIIFPAVQIASGLPWTMVHHLNATEYLNYENTKFSKSRGHGIFGSDVITLGLPADLWRYYLLAVRPEKQDSSFLWDEFLEKINKEFIDIIANFVNRTLVFLHKNFQGRVTCAPLQTSEQVYLKELSALEDKVTACMEAVDIKEALRTIIHIGKLANKTFQEFEPWFGIKHSPNVVHRQISLLTHTVKDLAILLSPFMPDTAQKIAATLGLSHLSWSELGKHESLHQSVIQLPSLLFNKLDPDWIASLKTRFSAQEASPPAMHPLAGVNLMVGRILHAETHPQAEHLLVETIDLGEATPRTVVSGIAKHYAPEALIGKHVLLVANLKPMKLRGIVSQGMLLCAETTDQCEVLTTQAPLGTLIGVQGYEPQKISDQPLDIKAFSQITLRCQDYLVCAGDIPLTAGQETLQTRIIKTGEVR